MLFTRDTVKIQKHEAVASKRMEKIHNANNEEKKAEVTMLISHKTNGVQNKETKDISYRWKNAYIRKM